MTTLEQIALRATRFPEDERDRYRARGYHITEPALSPALLSSSEWHPDTFLAIKSRDCQIGVLRALDPGRGAWARLLDRLRRAGFVITVVSPITDRFIKHLVRNGFSGPHRMHEKDGSTYAIYRDERRWRS